MKKIILFFIIINTLLISQENNLKISSEFFLNDNYNSKIFYNNNGIYKNRASNYLILDYSYKYKNLNIILKPVFSNSDLILNKIGLEFFHKNHFIKIGVLPYNSLRKNDFILSQNGEPFINFQFGTIKNLPLKKKKINNLIFGYDFFVGKLNSRNNFIHEIEYDEYIESKYIINPYFHKKTLNVGYKFPNFTFNLGLNHGVMFGGKIQKGDGIINPDRTMRAFSDAIAFQTSSENYYSADQNFEGNHLGYISFELFNDTFHLYYDKIFDDKSGLQFKNGFDGILGFVFSPSSLEYNFSLELLSTKNQSGNVHIEGESSGVDSYYWHHIYTSGWFINNHSLGHYLLSPFNNRMQALSLIFEKKISDEFNFSVQTNIINEFQHYGPKNTQLTFTDDKYNKWVNYTNINLMKKFKEIKYTFSLGYINDEIKLNTYKIKLEKDLF